jgi:hypothetical protein
VFQILSWFELFGVGTTAAFADVLHSSPAENTDSMGLMDDIVAVLEWKLRGARLYAILHCVRLSESRV